MTISELFEYVDAILENAFPDKIKLRWLNQVEAEIQIDVLLMAPEGIVQYTEADLNAELIVPTYYDQLYHEYLFWQICLAQQEDERANKYAVTYNRVYNEYVRFVCETVNPGDGMAEKVRYYLTAYQIAVKHGYTGTEAEWLRSLKGDKGDKGDGLHLLGVKETEAELPEMAENGDAYLVGTTEENNLYVYDNGWKNMGPLRGKDGKPGTPGKDGTSVTVESVQESSENGGTNIVNFSDGNTLHVKNGQDGGYYTPKVSQPSASTMKVSFTPSKADMPSVAAVNVTLPAGADGKTPTKGVDYFDGNDGITPHIGNNGNWFIGDTDTGKPSRGEDGEDGSDANVTAENIEAALGYKPANADDMAAGVHVGSEPPDDPNATFYIDTDDDPDDSGGGSSAQADWNAAEGEPGHILNRTHWSERVEVLPEQTLAYSEDDGLYVTETALVFVEGEAYRVKLDGVEYECVAWALTEEGVTVPVIGNKIEISGEDTGEPFVAFAMGGFLQFALIEPKPEITLSISVMQYHKIPAQYLYGGVHWIDAVKVDGALTQITVTPAQTAEAIRCGMDVKLRVTEEVSSNGDRATYTYIYPCGLVLALANGMMVQTHFVEITGQWKRFVLMVDCGSDTENIANYYNIPWVVISD